MALDLESLEHAYQDIPAVLTLRDLERVLQISKPTAAIVGRQLPAIRIGGGASGEGRSVRFMRRDLLKWLEEQAR